MDIADVIVIAVLLAILAVTVHAIRLKKGKDSGRGSCHSDCSSCFVFSSLYEDHRKDRKQRQCMSCLACCPE